MESIFYFSHSSLDGFLNIKEPQFTPAEDYKGLKNWVWDLLQNKSEIRASAGHIAAYITTHKQRSGSIIMVHVYN